MEEQNTNISTENLTEYKPIEKAKTYDKDSSFENNTSDFETVDWIKENERTFEVNNQNKVSVFDVAAYILNKKGEMSTMKLQKLVYYTQVWSLVWDEMPIFPEKIEAWANGPVVRELFDYHKDYFTISNIEIGNSDCLTETQKETIDEVLNYYGDKSAQWLIELTHLESPWKNARKGMSPVERGNRSIPLDTIAEYYSSL